MSRLLILLNNNNNKKCLTQLFKTISNLNNTKKNNSICFNSRVKYLSTKTELDKPQWERNDRYKIFYGFDDKDEANDKASAHFFTFFAFFSLFFVPGLLLYYYPDYKTNDWCHREAYLELARREKAGEPLVSPDYIPSERINLPSDEEIGDMEIII